MGQITFTSQTDQERVDRDEARKDREAKERGISSRVAPGWRETGRSPDIGVAEARWERQRRMAEEQRKKQGGLPLIGQGISARPTSSTDPWDRSHAGLYNEDRQHDDVRKSRAWRQQPGDRPFSVGQGGMPDSYVDEIRESGIDYFRRIAPKHNAASALLGSVDPRNFQLGGEDPQTREFRANLRRMGPQYGDVVRARVAAADSVNRLRDRATGNAPSIAAMQGQMQADQAMKRSLAMGASAQRGQMNPALQRQAMQQAAGAHQALAGQTATNVLRERMGAEQAYNQAAMGLSKQMSQQSLAGEQLGLGAMGHGLNRANAQLGADMQYANMDARERQKLLEMSMGIANPAPGRDMGQFLGTIGGGIVGGVGGYFAGGLPGAMAGSRAGAGLGGELFGGW